MKASFFTSFIPSLWIFPKGVAYKGPLPSNKLHLHRALQVLISPNKQITADQGRDTLTLNAEVVIIPPLTRHRIQPSLSNSLVIFFEPNSFIFEHYKDRQLISKNLSADEKALALDLLNADLPSGGHKIFSLGSSIAGFKEGDLARPQASDERIENLLKRLEIEDGASVRLEELSSELSLSLSRLIHLFSQELRMPFRSYYQWLKLRRALVCLASGQNLTASAHQAGFSDSSHFSRTFSHTFGFSPSFLKIMKMFSGMR